MSSGAQPDTDDAPDHLGSSPSVLCGDSADNHLDVLHESTPINLAFEVNIDEDHIFLDMNDVHIADDFMDYFEQWGHVRHTDVTNINTTSYESTSDKSSYEATIARVRQDDIHCETVSIDSTTDEETQSLFDDAATMFSLDSTGDPDPLLDAPSVEHDDDHMQSFLCNLQVACEEMATPLQQSLHALDVHLCETRQSRRSYYASQASSRDKSRAHIDGGAMASTTDQKALLAYFRPITNPQTVLKVADDRPHHPTGEGYLKVPSSNAEGYVLVRTFCQNGEAWALL